MKVLPKVVYNLSKLLIYVLFVPAQTMAGPNRIYLRDIDSGLTSPAGNYRWLDVADQTYSGIYQNSYNYTEACVSISYESVGDVFQGSLVAANLKPNFAYQIKLAGINGTLENEIIGLSGRWWQEEWDGSKWTNGQNLNNKGDGSSPNPNDLLYFDRRDEKYSGQIDPDGLNPEGLKYRFTGYLVLDYFITDESGNATLHFATNSSYHVLWKTTQRSRTALDGPVKTATFSTDPMQSTAYDIDYGETTVAIFGEWERLPVGGISPGFDDNLTAQLFITEESFHGSGGQLAGGWAAAMGSDFPLQTRIVVGDLNDDSVVGLKDVIVVLQVLADLPTDVNVLAEVDGDCSVGIGDALLLLQIIGNLREY